MARYNTSLSTGSINGSATIGSPYQGAFTELTGTAPYTVTLPSPVLYPGANQTFYNATSGVVTLSTPAGIFTGTGGTSSATVSVYAGNVVSVTSDGTNYIVISEDGSALIATTGNFSSNVDISGTLTVTPTGGVNLSPSTTGTINNVAIGGTTRASGNFTTLAANNQVTFTGNISSTTTGTGTLVVTGGLGVSGTINAANVSANLTGTIQTASQPNITSLGTLGALTVSGTGSISIVNATNYLRTQNYAEKSVDIGYFTHGTSNLAIDLRFGNTYINGWIEVEITGTYSNQNSTGILRKLISVGINPSNSFWYGPYSRIQEANGSVCDNIYIGDLEWDSVNSTYRITIYHTTSTGNNYWVNVRSQGSSATDVINGMTVSAQYTRAAPSPSRQYVHFNENVGIGTAAPTATLDVRGGIAVSGWSNNNGGTAGGVELGWDGSQALMQSYNRAGSAYTPVTLNGSYSRLMVSGSEVIRAHTNKNIGINNTNPQVALHVKASSGASGTLSLSGNAANDTGGASYILMGNTDSSGTTGPNVIWAANRTLGFGRGTSFSASNGGTITTDLQIDSSGNTTVNPSGSTAPITAVYGQFNEWPQWNSTYNVAIGKRRSYGWNMNAREYHTYKTQYATASSVGVFRISTDTANWMNTFIMIDVYSQYYSGGAVEKFYWAIGYGTNTLTQIYSAGGNQSTNFSVTAWGSGGTISGAPAAYKYYDFTWGGGYYQYPSFVVTVCDSMSLVSSITSSYQIQFL